MVTFEAFMERLAHGQLKNTAAVDESNLGVICPEYIDTILSLTNQGMTDISTRIPVFKAEVDLTFVDGQFIYPLVEAQVGTTLVEDTGEAFLDDRFIKIIDLYDAAGVRHNINTDGHIMTPAFNTLRFTKVIKTSMIENATKLGVTSHVRIRYQQKAATIIATDSINLPPNLLSALQLFVASLYLSHMGGEEHSQKGDSYFGTYLGYLGVDVERDLSSTSEVEEVTKFESRGFV